MLTRNRARRAVLAAAALVTVSGIAAGAFAATADDDRTREVRQSIEGGKAKNVILMIGDGLGDSEITIARNYAVGASGRLNIDRVPLTGAVTTHSVEEDEPDTPNYLPDSAPTATAWSTGAKTSNGRISTTPGTDRDLTTLLELAQARGLRVGNVTTSELTDATPAAAMAHISARGCQGPLNMSACAADLKSAGGPGSIAEQAADSGIDVLLGGGRARFDQVIPPGQPNAGRTPLQTADAQGYSVVTDAAGLQAARPGTPLLGLFTAGNMSVDWTGLPAARPASGPQVCQEDQRPADEPSLADMTTRALELLQAPGRGGRKPGFFLQVESASIDKRNHVSQPCEQIGETMQLDEAVGVALDFAEANPDTLVILTGDHAHTSQIVGADQEVPGFASKLTTADGAVMQVSYGTGTTPVGQSHTGSQIRVAAQGPQAANVIGVIDQTDLFRIMRRALRL